MLIVTQDKKRICNMDHIEQLHVDDQGQIWATFTDGGDVLLGRYSTQRQLSGVLEELLHRYRDQFRIGPETGVTFVANPIFGMPQNYGDD